MNTSASLHLLPFQAEDILKTLGQRVSTGRRTRGLTQQDLAAKAGISIRTKKPPVTP
jgi:ribosome-binding protein aMBF1 (putative translation factor)